MSKRQLQSGSVFELTLSMGGSAGNELAYNSLMLQSCVFQIDAGAKLKLAAVSLDYSSDFWGTSHIPVSYTHLMRQLKTVSPLR